MPGASTDYQPGDVRRSLVGLLNSSLSRKAGLARRAANLRAYKQRLLSLGNLSRELGPASRHPFDAAAPGLPKPRLGLRTKAEPAGGVKPPPGFPKRVAVARPVPLAPRVPQPFLKPPPTS